MHYFAIHLQSPPEFHYSGKSVNKNPLKHLTRTLRDYELFFVTEGELNIEQEREFSVKSGQFLMQRKDAFQGGTKPTPCTFFWLHFDGEVKIFDNQADANRFCSENEKWIFFAEYFTPPNPDRLVVTLTQLNHYCFEKERELLKNHLTAVLLSEISYQYELAFSPYVEDKRFSEILGWVRLHFNEPFSLVELAEAFEYNPKYLSTLFRKFTGTTLKAYLTEKRMNAAKQLLTSGNESVKQVAYKVGFEDEYYFMRVFKSATGMTPKQYRNTFCGCNYT